MALIYRDLPRAVLAHPDLDVDVRVLELLEVALRPFDQLQAGAGQQLRDSDLQPLPAVFGEAVGVDVDDRRRANHPQDRKSTRLNSSHSQISYAVFCLK